MTHPDTLHLPVMLAEVMKTLEPGEGKVYVDGTFGAGGYTRAILQCAPSCIVYAVDRDPDAIVRAKQVQKEFPNRLHVIEGNFADMEQLLGNQNHHRVDGVVLDLGVSSPQLDTAERGFSFQKEGPLDMRMDKSGVTAADVVNTYSEEKLAKILWIYGDEKKSRQIAKQIVHDRRLNAFKTTNQLVESIHRVIPRLPSHRIDPATKTFQALRIYVNQEILSLEKGLVGAEKILLPGGRLIVVSFHSTEDKIVKDFLQKRSGKSSNASRYIPSVEKKIQEPSFEMLNKKTVAPTSKEINRNPRARSAKLRWARRTNGSPWASESFKDGLCS